jgi:outer membrane protein insertion porin family
LISALVILYLITTPIHEFQFVGNEHIKSKTLTRELISEKGEEFNSLNTDFDVERIIRYYRSQGYFDTEVQAVADSTEKGITITFTVAEGPRPRIDRIDVHGAHKDRLLELFEIKENDFFLESAIFKTKENIEDDYKERGFAYAEVSSTVLPDSQILIFTVERGVVYYIRTIDVEGTKKSKPSVLLREIEFKEGERFSKSKLLKSQRRIYSLGFFGTVNVEMIKQKPDSIDLVFHVKELKSRIMNFGVGLSIPTVSFLMSFGLEELNFFNLGHRAQIQPSFRVNIDREWEIKLEGRYTIPYITPMKLTISLLPFIWFEDHKEFTRHTRGIESRLSKLFSDHIQFNLSNQYKYVDLRLKPGETLPDTIKGTTNSIKLQLMLDYRDEFFNPQKGFYVVPAVEYAGGILGGANHFVRAETEGRYFLPILSHVIAQRLRLGVLIPTDGVASYEEYSIGGQYSLRGYEEKSIGPDSIADEHYGRFLANYNLELRISLPWNLGIVGFFDAGYVNDEIDFSAKDYFKMSAGIGLRYYTPIGPIRADVGFPLMDEGREIYLGIYHIF